MKAHTLMITFTVGAGLHGSDIYLAHAGLFAASRLQQF
jgi:hypothetical protein